MNMVEVIGYDQFDAELNNFVGMVVVEFGQNGCVACAVMGQNLINAQVVLGDDAFKIVKVNLSEPENQGSIDPYKVKSVPTTIFIVKEEEARFVGARSKEEVIETVGQLKAAQA